MCVLLVGMRRVRLAAMEWAHVDFSDGIWNVPFTKGGEPESLSLSQPALDILKIRKSKTHDNYCWVFPGTGKTGHMINIANPRDSICKAAGIPRKGSNALGLHDLRRTQGAIQANSGVGLAIASRTLLNKNPETTRKIYTIVDHDPMRDAVNLAANTMKKLSNGNSALLELRLLTINPPRPENHKRVDEMITAFLLAADSAANCVRYRPSEKVRRLIWSILIRYLSENELFAFAVYEARPKATKRDKKVSLRGFQEVMIKTTERKARRRRKLPRQVDISKVEFSTSFSSHQSANFLLISSGLPLSHRIARGSPRHS